MKISQSFIGDTLKTGDLEPATCPYYLKLKYVDKMSTPPSDAMLYGQFFEWHLLGATRDMVEPIIPRKGVRDLRPTKSAGKQVKIDYLAKKGVYASGTSDELSAVISQLPPEMSPGEPAQIETDLRLVIDVGRKVLSRMGLDTNEGEKQKRLETGDDKNGEIGHIDWITHDFLKPERKALYDVKFTLTTPDDWRNGWGEPENKPEARVQSGQYLKLYYDNFGEWIPFYYLIFGKSGWMKVLKMVMTRSGLAQHQVLINTSREKFIEHAVKGWKPNPTFNKCLACPFSAYTMPDGSVFSCENRSVTPPVQTIEF